MEEEECVLSEGHVADFRFFAHGVQVHWRTPDGDAKQEVGYMYLEFRKVWARDAPKTFPGLRHKSQYLLDIFTSMAQNC